MIVDRPDDARLPLLWMTGSAVAVGATAGAALFYAPAMAVGLTVAVVGGALALVLTRFSRVIPAIFLKAMGLVLVGYAFLGRSFAYLGVPPVFVGELMLLFGLGAAVASRSLPAVARSPAVWAIVAFAACGVVGTVPYLSSYGIDALRDATLWGYGAMAVVVAGCILRTGAMPNVARTYGAWITAFAAWLPVAMAITVFFGDVVPNMPGTDLPVIRIKPGDAGVHLVGAATFVLAGLYQPRIGTRGVPRRSPLLFWPLWFVSLLFVAALSRGGLLSIVAGLLVVGTLEPITIGKRLVVGAGALLVAAAVLLPLSPRVADTSQSQVAASSEERAITPQQVVENILSIAGRQSEARGNLASTRDWRLDWWSSIVDYTLFGRYFWTGKGFGINLADEDGFQVAREDEAPLRSPHNVYMTVLARMGVPGAVLWLVLQACFILSMLAGFLSARRAGAQWWARVHVWILGYWCAFLVNASFDVFLEGPQGGIWFWCVTGLGIAAVESYRHEQSIVRWRRATA